MALLCIVFFINHGKEIVTIYGKHCHSSSKGIFSFFFVNKKYIDIFIISKKNICCVTHASYEYQRRF